MSFKGFYFRKSAFCVDFSVKFENYLANYILMSIIDPNNKFYRNPMSLKGFNIRNNGFCAVFSIKL